MQILILLAVVLGVSLAAPSPDVCSNINATTIKCMTDNGFPQQEALSLQKAALNGNLAAMNLTRFCGDKKDGYLKGVECLMNSVAACIPWITQMAEGLDFKKVLDVQCTDKNFKNNCLGLIKLPANHAIVLNCFKKEFERLKESSLDQRMCEAAKSIYVCEDAIVRPCDVYTADVYKQFVDPFMKRDCDNFHLDVFG
ncbi:uncharacterized protein LOC101851847 [Aplysia californica]|uniref:Uncharacterized protein LOC101851847 n=1 Tax=Aplysia californica TaxID=6500 RepID=A0ABM0JD69_APLCA|nr:uncharacterized protein LOC101851847 [Aplysia californica]